MRIKKQRVYFANIAIDMFFNRDVDISKCTKAAVIINGFPDFAGPSTFSSFLGAKNMIVFQPHIEGTYDSSGFFSPAGVKNTFSLINRMLSTSTFSDYPNGELITQPWNIDEIYIIGHSFGGMLVLRYSGYITPHSAGILFTSPALHYNPKYGCKEIGPEHYKSVKKKYPYTYRLAPIDAWDNIITGEDALPAECISSSEKIRIIYGENDSYFDINTVNAEAIELVKKYIQSDDCTLQIIEDAGHSSAELLKQNSTIKIINELFGIG